MQLLTYTLILCANIGLFTGDGNGRGADAPLIQAIWEVETTKAPDYKAPKGAVGEIGPLQITKAAWQDAGLSGSYEDCETLEYSAKVFWAYTDRWAGKDASNEDRARCWNSGPKWRDKKEKTNGYWKKVEKVLKDK